MARLKPIPIIPAPDWLKKRMTDLRSESPAPLSEVIRQGVASERHRKNSVIQAPDWVKERTRKVRSQPPPTLERVRQQMQASTEYRRKSTDTRGTVNRE